MTSPDGQQTVKFDPAHIRKLADALADYHTVATNAQQYSKDYLQVLDDGGAFFNWLRDKVRPSVSKVDEYLAEAARFYQASDLSMHAAAAAYAHTEATNTKAAAKPGDPH